VRTTPVRGGATRAGLPRSTHARLQCNGRGASAAPASPAAPADSGGRCTGRLAPGNAPRVSAAERVGGNNPRSDWKPRQRGGAGVAGGPLAASCRSMPGAGGQAPRFPDDRREGAMGLSTCFIGIPIAFTEDANLTIDK